MVEELVKSLAERLREMFDGYEVYTESVAMGAEKPSFFVECEEAEKVQLLGKRFILRISLSVTLESDSDRKRSESESIMPTIFEAMSVLKTEERIVRGRSLTGRNESGRLVMRGVYDVFMTDEISEDKIFMMETMSER
jgi:hypothetical protein